MVCTLSLPTRPRTGTETGGEGSGLGENLVGVLVGWGYPFIP